MAFPVPLMVDRRARHLEGGGTCRLAKAWLVALGFVSASGGARASDGRVRLRSPPGACERELGSSSPSPLARRCWLRGRQRRRQRQEQRREGMVRLAGATVAFAAAPVAAASPSLPWV